MTTSTVAAALGKLLFVAVVTLVISVANALSSVPELSDWEQDQYLTLQLTVPLGSGDAKPIRHRVVPLTEAVGMNQSVIARESITIKGTMVPTEEGGWLEFIDSNSIAYLNCDNPNSTSLFDQLMAKAPKAILLFSLAGAGCRRDSTDDWNYTTIFTMTDQIDARDTLNLTMSGSLATITGDYEEPDDDDDEDRTGHGSPIAMNILYSITGVITLLFLAIIATGAIRAHRYPERYGPRPGYGGRPSQSRAKGLARAVLETLPIVKFGEKSPAKPDPDFQLEQQPSRSSQDPTPRAKLSAIQETVPSIAKSQGPMTVPSVEASEQASSATVYGAQTGMTNTAGDIENTTSDDINLGCPICTEDFTIGEDVRVLPCNHRYHPACVDPWLVNISGTCPLCRLDLRPHSSIESTTGPGDNHSVSLPTAAGDNAQQPGTSGSPMPSTAPRERRRSLRILDLHRLRAASIEERMEILRRHRSQQQQRRSVTGSSLTSDPDNGESTDSTHRARLAERFRGRLRASRPPSQAQPQPTEVDIPTPTP
ncbi:hypothetical protein NEUTE1DRAFT_101788 [Neurospora tetrasperma FGSC 2508]|uniref:RING-type domain-containing protein n=1 Tax=Neurospora tetrasperma (strain FGSC 2508 / ATCC MYA-4615 / P0657) TaxID=510951 RepID=F8MQ79_NEUT8|nr:uncharacterized protein NEUTE1DRAFT_101788 [Neurospora tetrasperma FGSC 2508]EGO56509.1 hypothetical protein NEUTE1DRAFT_101788 [Neurospora tetrasperma FGSC 2508]EGZ70622.1 hypothetical protein NEUTE2DRAFT_69568 [Neurospora tetrasperma FGSC 2509]